MENNISSIRDLIEMTSSLNFIDPADVPSIELYMDQVTTFLEEKLNNNKRNEEEKTMTKTMINNYTKNDLLPPPNKKRYTKEHLILLIYIYYLKNLLCINDIQTLLKPMIEDYFGSNDPSKSIDQIYAKIFNHQKDHYKDIQKSIMNTFNRASEMYDPQNEGYLHDMSLIALLSADVYVKKKYIEHLIDNMRTIQEKEAKAKEKEAKAKEKEAAMKAKDAAMKAKASNEARAKAAQKAKSQPNAKGKARATAKTGTNAKSGADQKAAQKAKPNQTGNRSQIK